MPGAACKDKAGNLLETAPKQAKLSAPTGICVPCWKKALREGLALQAGAAS